MSGPYRETERIEHIADRLRRQTLPELECRFDCKLDSALARSVEPLLDDEPLHERLVASTGLSLPMVKWALGAALQSISSETLTALRETAAQKATRQGLGLCALVLSGNVFTACIRSILLPLAFRIPLLIKASSRDDVLPRALIQLLPSPFREATAVLTYPGGDRERDGMLLSRADTIHVYGSDETCASLRELAPPQATFVAHGHGMGIALIPAKGLDARLPEEAAALALDIAAYDQRGCLSPQEAWVIGGYDQARRFADALHVALTQVERPLPRGSVPLEVRGAASQWFGTVQSLGTLLAGPTHAVGVEEDTPLPRGPGWRHILVRAIDEDDLGPKLAAFGPTLKAIGTSDPSLLESLAPAGIFPWVTELGNMQRPPIDAWLDGLPPSEGLLRLATRR